MWRYLAAFLLWNLAAGAALLFTPPPLGLLAALLLAGALLWGVLLRGGPDQRAALRLRGLTPQTLRWTLIAVPVLLLLSWSLGEVYTRLVPIPTEDLNPFGPVLRTSMGRLSIAVLAVAVAPIVEEFVFRGVVQRSLERRWGAAAGILGAAALFALVHFIPRVFPLHLVLGLAFGFAVWATRSIWSGVVLHAANNSVAMLGLGLAGEEELATPTLWEAGWTPALGLSLALLLLASVLAAWTARRLWEAGRGGRSR